VTALFDDLQWRGLVHQVTDEELGKLLDHDTLTIYVGFDPTADSLGMHHLVGLLTLRRLAAAGHRPIALVGGATGLVGDPSGKTEERTLLSAEQLARNVAAVRAQVQRIVGDEAEVVDNADWIGALSVTDFLRDVGKYFSVNEMIRKESVRARLEGREQGISFTEFSYMLLQAYDFLHLYRAHGCRLQMGGSDQWGNITEGVDLIRRTEGGSAFGLTWPLVTKADGTKFGKTEGGTVWLDPAKTSPYQFFQFWIRTDDRDVVRYLRQFTFIAREEIDELEAAVAERPERREAQQRLAYEVTTLVHGADEAAKAKRASEVLFTEGIAELDEQTFLDVLGDAPTVDVAGDTTLVGALTASGLSKSNSDARRSLDQGAVYVNNVRQSADRPLAGEDFLYGKFAVLRRGKREYCLIRLGS
jgi:tyrosyl-tRNA synthetase